MRKVWPPATIGDNSQTFQIEPPLPRFDTAKRTCARFGFGLSKFYDLAGQGLILTRKLGKRTLVDQASVLKYIEGLPAAPINLSARRRRQAPPV
jgi:hypothetical protein